jgi:PAS domain S-box-containing protein
MASPSGHSDRSPVLEKTASNRAGDPRSGTRLQRQARAGFVAAVVLSCALGLFSWLNARQAATNAAWVTHTQQVLTALEQTLRHIVDVETGGRGFALSGHAMFLESYTTGKSRLPQDFEQLRGLVADNPAQEDELQKLAAQAQAKVAASDAIVAARKHSATIPTLPQLEHGKEIMDGARATVQRMEDHERRLLEIRSQRTAESQRFTTYAIALGSLLGAVFLSLAGATVSRQIGVAAIARAQVDALNADLEQRVMQRTAELEESNGRLTGIIQSAMDAILTVDEAHRVVIFNAAAEKMFGCPRAQAAGENIERFIPKRFRGEHASHIRRFAETGVTSRTMGTLGEIWGLRANGEEFPLEASISQVQNEGRRLFTVILRDISERLRAEEAAARLAAVVEFSDDAIISKNLQGIITTWNSGAERLFGYAADEILGKPMLLLFPPEQAAEEAGILARIGRGESVKHYETMRVHKDGRRIDVSVTISPIKDRAGAIVGASKVARDIGERKRLDAALETQTLMLQSVLDCLGEGLVAADEKGKFILWNPAAEKITGMDAAEVPSSDWAKHYGVFRPDTVTPFPAEENPLICAIGGESARAEMFLRNASLPEGGWIEATANPLRDKAGVLRGGVIAFRDITQRILNERKIRALNDELEQRVIQRTEQLQAANKELESFTYSVSHDLRAPLRHISGFSKILDEEYGAGLPPEAQNYLHRIQEGTRRMGQLVDELLSLARVGRQSLSRQKADLGLMVWDVVQMLEPEIGERQVEWKIGELPIVECDPVLVRQILQNLLANALKYSRPRPKAVIEIGLTSTPTNGPAVFFVKDNGVGFNMKYADKLFGVFQRLHRAEEFEGTGVGLATVQRIVQKHGGRVWAEAELDKGATFYFTLGEAEAAERQIIRVEEEQRKGAALGGNV